MCSFQYSHRLQAVLLALKCSSGAATAEGAADVGESLEAFWQQQPEPFSMHSKHPKSPNVAGFHRKHTTGRLPPAHTLCFPQFAVSFCTIFTEPSLFFPLSDIHRLYLSINVSSGLDFNDVTTIGKCVSDSWVRASAHAMERGHAIDFL